MKANAFDLSQYIAQPTEKSTYITRLKALQSPPGKVEVVKYQT